MSYGITAEDMVGICIVLAEGNVMLSMEDVILQAEEFQEIKKIHYGTQRFDKLIQGKFKSEVEAEIQIFEQSSRHIPPMSGEKFGEETREEV